MVDSDEEGEIIPECVKDYHFLNHYGKPISFASLPLQWSEDEILGDVQTQVFLHGTGDDGFQEICKRVIAWKFELSYSQPEIYVLSKDKIWIQLQQPNMSFQNLIRSTLLTVSCLHFLKNNAEASDELLWNYLVKTFSSQEYKPSKIDLGAHMSLIMEAAKRDKDLEKSKCLLSLMGVGWKDKTSHEDHVDDINHDIEELDLEVEQLADTVCAICDNGGEILCCEGGCMRSFHATLDAAGDSLCETLGFRNNAQVEAIPIFWCNNCKFKKHQCFACGRLGSSDRSSGAEVFRCVSATCGYFYHPKCVAELLHAGNKIQAEELREKIAGGETFTCPAHKCFVCHQIEDARVHELQFALCRRCPWAYHRKCLPEEISFESVNGAPVRAWDGLLPNRILVYCMAHTILAELGTPARDHLIFPDDERKKMMKQLPSKRPLPASMTENAPRKLLKTADTIRSMANDLMSAKTGHTNLLGKTKISDAATKSPKFEQTINDSDVKSIMKRGKQSSGKSFSSLNLGKSQRKMVTSITMIPKNRSMTNNMIGTALPFSLENTEMQNRIQNLIRKSNSSIDADEFIKKQNAAWGHAMLPKNMTLGKVEGYVEAIRAALRKLEAGSTVEEAKEICEPWILKQIVQWKRRLKVYMAPFLYGPRYTSFGRHFTKAEKLAEIVDRLKWYVQIDDTIVDFCCGANEFSLLMKEKLDGIEKHCYFRNYDLFPPQNMFNFERRDWMTVDVEELPEGSKLIMGLNPPFGVNATLANKFIEKALEFKPKLLILIVPEETKRLDTGAASYDLIWKDSELLQGKAFYLPGSVNVHNQRMEDWNASPPPLYLWSRRDWTSRHKLIAEKHGHLAKDHMEMHAPESPIAKSTACDLNGTVFHKDEPEGLEPEAFDPSVTLQPNQEFGDLLMYPSNVPISSDLDYQFGASTSGEHFSPYHHFTYQPFSYLPTPYDQYHPPNMFTYMLTPPSHLYNPLPPPPPPSSPPPPPPPPPPPSHLYNPPPPPPPPPPSSPPPSPPPPPYP